MYLEALPSAEMYERSYMHRDTITHVAVAPETDFFITGSVDGHLKFWKKKAEGVEFAKHFRAHLGGVDGALVRASVCMSAHAQDSGRGRPRASSLSNTSTTTLAAATVRIPRPCFVMHRCGSVRLWKGSLSPAAPLLSCT